MNKIFQTIVAFLCFGAVATLQAQDTGIAVKGGLNFNTMSISVKNGSADTSGLESNLGYHLGVTYEKPITDFLFTEVGLFLDTRGLKVVEKYTRSNDRIEINRDALSLTVPTTLKGKFEVANDVRLFVEGGVHLNFLLSLKTHTKEIEDGKTIRETTTSEDFEKAKERFGFGLTFGGGVEYRNFIFGLGYDLGLRDYDEDEDITVNLNAFKIGVGYRF